MSTESRSVEGLGTSGAVKERVDRPMGALINYHFRRWWPILVLVRNYLLCTSQASSLSYISLSFSHVMSTLSRQISSYLFSYIFRGMCLVTNYAFRYIGP